MSLDPQMQGLLNAFGALKLPPYEELTAETFRALADAKRVNRGQGEPLAEVSDRQIAGNGSDIAVRLYRPHTKGVLPALVYFHGGGFVLGDLDSHDNLCRALSNRLGALVVSVDYRRAPEAKFPAAFDDAWSAVQWVAGQALELSIDPSRLLVGGDSAGGNLAANVCIKARDSGGPAIAHQLLFYPVCDNDLGRTSYHEVGIGYFLETDMMRWFWEQYLTAPQDADKPYCCPLKADDLYNLPPATLVVGGYDPLKDEGLAYIERLRLSGVPVHSLVYPGAIHGFMSYIGMLQLSNQALNETIDALQTALARV
ncbi:alpha/beta hydrolase [Pseudomonas sp. GD03860]|uniref:alpha/beta hydrolase n=1 Tax=Pseudomonas TaxID=286 RepID=UPI0023640925|nr:MULTISPECIES: alpha/beta hydrolase [Pseudomonas]MDD2058397.1 alpha/beta hydrolase [Pseudomonas putida]MDH0640209.1 alpha/beta hydrolase [Pseudomonas sp. GD03860]